MQSTIIQKYVLRYIEKMLSPFWVDDVSKYLKIKLGINVQQHQLRDFIKESFGLAYKKGVSRPINLNIKLMSSLKYLFWIRLAKSR